MASRHEIIHIDFQANAGKANAALEALRSEAARTKKDVEQLQKALANAKAANFPVAQIQQLEAELKKAQTEHKQWQSALNNNLKGVRALDEAIKVFNRGKGSVEQMNAALSKTALNAANLQKGRSKEGSKTWNEMSALAKALEQNILRANTATNQLVSTIKNGDAISKSTLTQARSDLQQLIALENQGSNAWKKYTSQLKTVEGALAKITVEEQQMAGKNTLAQVFRGDYITKSNAEIQKMIASLREYQTVIADPSGKGYRHFNATETAIKKLSEQLGKTKGDIISVSQAMRVAGASGTANRFGSGLEEHGKRVSNSLSRMLKAYRQLNQERNNIASRSIALPNDAETLKKLDAQIASIATQYGKLRTELQRTGEANNLTNRQVQQSIQVLRQQQETVAVGSPAWQKYEEAIAHLEQRMKIMRGEAISLRDAMKLSGKAGGIGFTGTSQQLQLAEQALQKAMSTAKKGSPTWEKYRQALAKVRLEMQNAGITSERMRSILDKPINARNLNELQAAVKRAKAELDLMAGTVGKNSTEYAKLAKQTKNAEIQLKSMQAQSHGTASAFEKAWSRLKTYIGLYVGAAVAMQKIVSTLGDIMELSDKMGEVRKTTGFTADEVGRLSESLAKLDTRTSLTGLMELSAAAGQLGLKTEDDVRGFTEAANMLMVALPEMGREGATQMLKVALATGEIDRIGKQMREGVIDGSSAVAVAMEKIGSTIDQLRANSAAAAPAITDFVQRVGAVGAQSGISIDQVAALGSTVDALGMRVEMSATALSRMIPAIKNNAFEVARAINVTPDTLRNLFDTGRGMEAILMIFQHIKDAGMDEDSIESMLGMGNMKEIMKELNQMGARAGIVFAGLSQNVDELRRQLGVAKTAYEENIAIQNEYNKMNDTTAAKWARLKNQLEEAFVGDKSQRVLGGIVDTLRNIVDFLTGNVGPALRFVSGLVKVFFTYWAILKIGLGEGLFVKSVEGLSAMGRGLKNLIHDTQASIKYSILLRKAHTEQAKAAIEARMAQEGLNKAMIANIWTALVVAIGAAVYALYNWIDGLKEGGREAAKFQAELDKEQKKVNELTDSIGNARVKIEAANKEVEKAKAALDAAKKATDGSAESTKRLAKAEADLVSAEEKKRDAMATSKRLIEQFNSQYSQYLGFMLSEVASNIELARARDLVNSKLRETLTLKRQEAAIERVEKDKGGARDEEYANLYDFVGRFTEEDPTQRPRVMAALVQAAKSAKDKASFSAQAQKIFKDNNVRSSDALLRQAVDYFEEEMNVREATNQVMDQFKGEQTANRRMSQNALVLQVNAGISNYNKLLKDFQNANNGNRAQRAAAVLQQMDTMMEIANNASSYFDLSNPEEAKQFKQLQARVSLEGTDRNAILKAAGSYYKPRKTVEGENNQFTLSDKYTSSISDGNLWGNVVDATSTEYSTWDVNELVRRRQQMNKFKNVLKPGIEVRKVLAEDKALMKAIDEGKVGEDWQSVLNWYNAERLKIQKELKGERFSTNEGNWRDEKNGRKRKNPFIESDYALAELDRYYSRRKEALEKARSEENISEELYNRQLEILEQEHLERRSTLRATFTKEISNKEIQQFRKWWDVLEKQDELDHVPWATVESEWSKAIAAQIGRNNLRMQQDMTKVESITMKHVNAIAKIIAKERPYDSITENLQANLTKLDILFADLGVITKQQLEDGTLANELNRRLSFLLGETEHAYSLTAEQLMRDMGENGFHAWASAIANAENADDLKQRLLAQLRVAYDAVQDAIKKEASLIKKQAEIQWNDTVIGGKSQKQLYESTLSALGLSEDQVKRANSLIGAGPASERVADRLAIKQMQIRLAMQAQYYALMRKIGEERIKQLEAAGKLEDAEHLRKSLNLSLSEEQKKLDEQRVAIQNQLEESQNRLYTEMKAWTDLITSSLRGVFEASNAGNAEYYNERAKLDLTGKGGPGAGTYIVIDNEGTSDASAHFEYLDERGALERHREIEQQNALADAWRKLMDDINMKMSETITDQMNAMLQNQSIDANTQAVIANTEALYATSGGSGRTAAYGEGGKEWLSPVEPTSQEPGAGYMAPWTEWAEQSNRATVTMVNNNKKVALSTQSSFAKMTQAANLYGIAYQAMSNENLSTAQKFEMIAIQAAGQAAITSLTASGVKMVGDVAVQTPSVLAKIMSELGPIAGPIAFGAFTALIGGLMGLATSKLTKAKGQIAAVTGASGSSAGRLATGMLQYAEGNVNEFTDPSSLRAGQTYQVDAANGKTYKARYMGKGAKTHITNGPEFHLVGEEGREAIIDAKTTRNIRLNEPEIWRSIQTLYNGGSLSHMPRRRGRGVAAFADGNLDEMGSGGTTAYGENGMSPEQMMAMQASLDRNSEVLERALNEGIKAVFDVYGKGGLVDSYDTGKKTVNRHGERY